MLLQLSGRFRPKADIRRSARSAPCWVRLFIGLLAGFRRPKIEWYQGDTPLTVRYGKVV